MKSANGITKDNKSTKDSSKMLLDVTHLPESQLVQASAKYILAKARNFSEPFLDNEKTLFGEPLAEHVEGIVHILKDIGATEDVQAIAYISATWEYLSRPIEILSKTFGKDYAKLAQECNRLVEMRKKTTNFKVPNINGKIDLLHHESIENARRMLLAFSRDLRVIFLILASCLQNLRYHARQHKQPAENFLIQAKLIFSPLANRLGLRDIKWEIEDLSFRFANAEEYFFIAQKLGAKRIERERYIEQLCVNIQQNLELEQIDAQVHGRPKNIYGIYKKMQGKNLSFEQVFDVLAIRILVNTVNECYQVLDWLHTNYETIASEFDDYIAKPKPNGYKSIHTVICNEKHRPIEVQIRTFQMHEESERGVAAHWAYKEAGAKGYSGVSADGSYDQKIAILRNLLEWKNDVDQMPMEAVDLFDDRIYVFTPQARLIDLPKGATPLDFAYALHTDIGHRCRGAKVDGQLVSLNTTLNNGQTVEITTIKEGGPSRDWLNPELKFLISNKAKAKVRAWFNLQITQEKIKKGREAIEKLMQRKGKTAVKLEDIADRLGFKILNELFEIVGKEDYSLKNIEAIIEPVDLNPTEFNAVTKDLKPSISYGKRDGVLVVGVDSLLTQLAKCCRPAPPDEIVGYVTRGKGVSIHRLDCTNLKGMLKINGERIIDVSWDDATKLSTATYIVDISLECTDHIDILQKVLDVFAKLNIRIVSIKTQTMRGKTFMLLSIEMKGVANLTQIFANLNGIKGVINTKRAMN